VACFDTYNFLIPLIFKFGCVVSLVIRVPWVMNRYWFYNTDLCITTLVLGFLVLVYPSLGSSTIYTLYYTLSIYASLSSIVLNMKLTPTHFGNTVGVVFHHHNCLLTYYFVMTKEEFSNIGILRNFFITNIFGFLYFSLQMVLERWLQPNESVFVFYYPKLKESLKNVAFYPLLIRVLEHYVPSLLDSILFVVSIYLVFFAATLISTVLLALNARFIMQWFWIVWLKGVLSGKQWYDEVPMGWYHL